MTKLATSLAALVAVEEETVGLDEPAGPPGSTLRHLLAHASGLGPEAGPAVAPPGTTRIYSNAGYEMLAEFLEARAGIPFAEYLSVGVLDPLGMSDTLLDPPSAAGAAAGLTGPLVDLLALGCELLAPTLVSTDTHREAVTVQFEGLAGVLPGFGRFDALRLGARPGDPRRQATALDRQRQCAVHLRPFRTVRLVPLGRPSRRGGVRRPQLPPLRALGRPCLAGPRRRGPRRGRTSAPTPSRPGPIGLRR